ncbi:hypothetical protein VQ7734_00146 [Vibrio quintilis]|uniref:Uncharacterized protein n=1 Tax=Vibrio quintilis TaxID=1117707 RepID=A0A1M7YP89_9VIBR|nr:hypothetical protein VQ7734_00146 [Vibrio quintilis]
MNKTWLKDRMVLIMVSLIASVIVCLSSILIGDKIVWFFYIMSIIWIGEKVIRYWKKNSRK